MPQAPGTLADGRPSSRLLCRWACRSPARRAWRRMQPAGVNTAWSTPV